MGKLVEPYQMLWWEFILSSSVMLLDAADSTLVSILRMILRYSGEQIRESNNHI